MAVQTENCSNDNKGDGSVDVTAMVDSAILNRLFVKQAKEDVRKVVEKKPAGKTILDMKRAQNVSIVLARLKFSPEVNHVF